MRRRSLRVDRPARSPRRPRGPVPMHPDRVGPIGRPRAEDPDTGGVVVTTRMNQEQIAPRSVEPAENEQIISGAQVDACRHLSVDVYPGGRAASSPCRGACDLSVIGDWIRPISRSVGAGSGRRAAWRGDSSTTAIEFVDRAARVKARRRGRQHHASTAPSAAMNAAMSSPALAPSTNPPRAASRRSLPRGPRGHAPPRPRWRSIPAPGQPGGRAARPWPDRPVPIDRRCR